MSKSRRGFASMEPSRVLQIARSGGKASQESGNGHRWDPESAKQAGLRGQQLVRERRAQDQIEQKRARSA